MTKYTFSLKNNPSTFCAPKYKSTDYSKVLDDLIAADIKEKNPWLYGYNTSSTYNNSGNNTTIKIKLNGFDKPSDDLETAFLFGGKKYYFTDAFSFLKNLAFKCPFKKNTTYKLSNGDYIEITDDYIHINEKMYFFNLMDNDFFYNLGADMKKTIATIYVDGLKITIKK